MSYVIAAYGVTISSLVLYAIGIQRERARLRREYPAEPPSGPVGDRMR